MTDSKRTKQFLLHVALIGAFSLVVMASAFYYGAPSGNDSLQHYEFAATVQHSIQTGEIYPSWAGTQNRGYGDVAIRFYPPLAYYWMSAGYFLVGNWYDASLLTFFLIFWAGGVGVYLWTREAFPADQSLLAAGLYVFAPYHINQIYNNFLYAEFAASAVLPFCFLFAGRVCRRGRFADVLSLSVSFALLLLTHLPLSVIGSLALFVYALTLLKKETFFKTVLKLTAAIAFSVTASSFYWIRMITEMSWIKHSSDAYFSETFDYSANFLFAPQNILNFQTDTSVLWFADLMLLATLLVSIPSFVLLFKNRRLANGFMISLGALFLVSVVMTTHLSQPIWDNFSILQKVQFPWRWMGIVSMSGAAFSSFGIFRVAAIMNESKNHLLSIGVGLILTVYVFTAAFVVKQAVYVPREQFDEQLAGIESAQSFECWWTIWAKPDAMTIKDKITIENRSSEILEWNSTTKKFRISAGQIAQVRVAALYYPHWRATINDEPADVEKSADGAISISISENESTVELDFIEPAFVKTAYVVSASVWLIFFAATFFVIWEKLKADFPLLTFKIPPTNLTNQNE